MTTERWEDGVVSFGLGGHGPCETASHGPCETASIREYNARQFVVRTMNGTCYLMVAGGTQFISALDPSGVASHSIKGRVQKLIKGAYRFTQGQGPTQTLPTERRVRIYQRDIVEMGTTDEWGEGEDCGNGRTQTALEAFQHFESITSERYPLEDDVARCFLHSLRSDLSEADMECAIATNYELRRDAKAEGLEENSCIFHDYVDANENMMFAINQATGSGEYDADDGEFTALWNKSYERANQMCDAYQREKIMATPYPFDATIWREHLITGREV